MKNEKSDNFDYPAVLFRGLPGTLLPSGDRPLILTAWGRPNPHCPGHEEQFEMPEIPDITDNETWTIRTTLMERYPEEVELQMADAEIRLQASDRELSNCPVWYWQYNGCHFVIFKTGEKKYRSQFFYKPYRQYGTGVYEYTDITDCVVSLLQAQADHEAKEQGNI
jgi:hypothetical protein